MHSSFDKSGRYVGMPKHLNPYVNYGVGQTLNRNTGQIGKLGRTSATTAAFVPNNTAEPAPAPLPMPPLDGPGGSGGGGDAPGEVPEVKDSKGSVQALYRAADTGGYSVGVNPVRLREPIGPRTPPSLAALLNGLRY